MYEADKYCLHFIESYTLDLSRYDFRLSNKAVMQLGCSRVL